MSENLHVNLVTRFARRRAGLKSSGMKVVHENAKKATRSLKSRQKISLKRRDVKVTLAPAVTTPPEAPK